METLPRNWRLFLALFLVKIWRLKAWLRLIVPLAAPQSALMRFFLFSSWAYKAPLIRTLRRAEIIPPLSNPGSPVPFFLFGRKHHRRLPASHFRRLLDLSVFIQFMAQTLQNAHADVLVSHLPDIGMRVLERLQIGRA